MTAPVRGPVWPFPARLPPGPNDPVKRTPRPTYPTDEDALF